MTFSLEDKRKNKIMKTFVLLLGLTLIQSASAFEVSCWYEARRENTNLNKQLQWGAEGQRILGYKLVVENVTPKGRDGVLAKISIRNDKTWDVFSSQFYFHGGESFGPIEVADTVTAISIGCKATDTREGGPLTPQL